MMSNDDERGEGVVKMPKLENVMTSYVNDP